MKIIYSSDTDWNNNREGDCHFIIYNDKNRRLNNFIKDKNQ
jgi:hypothetical protein